MLTIDIVKDEIKKVIENRGSLLEEGKYGNELNDADYLIVYKNLSNQYGRDTILNCVIDHFGLSVLQYSSLNEVYKQAAIIFISSLFSIKEEHVFLIKKVFDIELKALTYDKNHFISSAVYLAKLDHKYNKKKAELETKAMIDCKNDFQLVYNSSRVYSDICEGVFSIVIIKLIFSIQILRNKKKNIEDIIKHSETDNLNIIKSYDIELFNIITQSYNSIIRNATSHEDINFKDINNIIYTNTNRDGVKTTQIESIYSLNDKIENLHSISEAIIIAQTAIAFHKEFDECIKSFDYINYSDFFDKEDAIRRLNA